MFNKAKGGNYHGYYNAHHYHRRVGRIVRRRRLLLEKTVGVASHLGGRLPIHLSLQPDLAREGIVFQSGKQVSGVTWE